MKRIFPLNVISICAVTVFMSTSCIYDAPGDRFYRTLWTCNEMPLGKITIEFLCGNQISVQSPDAAGSYGTYESDGHTARFNGLTLMYESEAAAALALTGSEEIAGRTGKGAGIEADVKAGIKSDVKTDVKVDIKIDVQADVPIDTEGVIRSNGVKSATQKIIIEEAHRRGDILTISWHLDDSSTAKTTRLTRLSAYE